MKNEIACALSPEALQARREGLLAELVKRSQRCERVAEGLRLHFQPDEGLIPLIGRMIDAERKCCRFLRFDLTVAPDDGPVTLDLTGPPGTADFIGALLEPPA
jgi:hypothetical protein